MKKAPTAYQEAHTVVSDQAYGMCISLASGLLEAGCGSRCANGAAKTRQPNPASATIMILLLDSHQVFCFTNTAFSWSYNQFDLPARCSFIFADAFCYQSKSSLSRRSLRSLSAWSLVQRSLRRRSQYGGSDRSLFVTLGPKTTQKR